MKHTEQNTKTLQILSTGTGLFALLGAFSRVKGTGAPKTSRRLILSVLVTTCGVLSCGAGTALAASPPEPPVTTEPAEIKSTTAVLQGVVNPLKAATVSWFFEYKKGSLCTGGSTTPVEGPAEVEAQPVGAGIEDLTANTEYAVCLVAENEAKEHTQGNTIIFTTATPPQTPKTEAATGILATTAILHGELNPTGEAETGYHFIASTQGACGDGGAETEPVAPAKVKAKTKVEQKIEGLQPHAKYVFCLVATNAAGEAAQSANEGQLETPAAPPAVESVSASNVKASSVTLEGTVNPNNESTECKFQYGPTNVAENEIPCAPELLKGYGGQSVSSTQTNEKGEATRAIAGLTANTTYKYRILATNGAGAKTGEGTFTTSPLPETPEATAASEISGVSAKLEGVLNPGGKGEPGTYEFLYKQSSGECALGQGELAQDKKEQAEGKPGIYTQKTAPSSAGTSALGTREGVSAAVSGLLAGSEYTFCLRATNTIGETATSAPVTFMTSAIGGENSPTVTASEALLSAEIGSENEETTYQLQYGAASVEEHSLPTPSASIPASPTPVEVQQRIAGLQPATTYRFRFIASNGHGAVDGEERTFTTPVPAETSSPAEARCKEEHPSQPPRAALSAALPDCRAYELVSPLNTGGQDATDAELNGLARAAALDREEGISAITYLSTGTFADPAGAPLYSQYLSRREAGGWTTQTITPPQAAGSSEASFDTAVFTPELSAGIAGTRVSLPGTDAPAALGEPVRLYRDDFVGEDPYRYVGGSERPYPWGASEDLSHVVFGEGGGIEGGGVSEWVDGNVIAVGVANERNESISASVGTASFNPTENTEKDAWRAVSSNGSRVYFTSPATEREPHEVNTLEPPAQLFVRVNAGRLQSPLGGPEANGTGNLTQRSNVVSSLVAASGLADMRGGSSEVTLEVSTVGRFVVGDAVIGGGIAAGTTITAIDGARLTLSAPDTGTGEENEVPISSAGPYPFVVGETVSGDGIPAGARVMAMGAGTLTLSVPAASSGSGVELRAGGECTVVGDACTIDVSASQRLKPNPAGRQLARFWGASANGSRVFFTSTAELTEDANTGADGEAANLYEYDLERPAGESRLKDLTVDGEGDGAAVQGVAQISEDGSYVYYVATGVLTGTRGAALKNVRGEEPRPGGDNLYVSHEGGAPVFITTLAAGDTSDWLAGNPEYPEPGPAVNTAALNPAGWALAFVSERPLTGYDNEQAARGDCEIHNPRGALWTETGACREVFVYDARADSLVCASCDPSGARPAGPASFGEAGAAPSSYRVRNLSEDGSVFFDSWDALAGASGGIENVYEYQDGAVHALSSVTGGHESFFLDASVSGSNVFFATADRLSRQDPGGNVVVYDARVGGGFSEPGTPPPCDNGDACKPPPAAQPSIYGAPASQTFSGPGNVIPPTPAVVKKVTKKTVKCKRGDVKSKKGRCVPKKKKKSKKAKKPAHANRRASR